MVVGASVQPAYDVSGVVFDYALSERRARLAMFDAGPRTGDASYAVVNALAAYRAARRDGASPAEQYTAVGQEVAGTGAVVTGVLAELDLVTGELRWLDAGHPPPLIVRGDAVLPETGAAATGFGRPPRAGEVRLRPGDVVALYSPGLAGARDRAGTPFGRERAAGFLTGGTLPPEAARLLTQAVVAHTGGELRSDVGVLVARWLPR